MAIQGIVNPSFYSDINDNGRDAVEIVGMYRQGEDNTISSVLAYNNAAAMLAAVSIRNGKISYRGKDGKPAACLEGFNMTVPRGAIYSLLGSSGCGKTTALKCIVGVQHLDEGDVKVFGESPGTKECGLPGRIVGYMPQEEALYDEFTIAEILSYFGKIYSMPKKEVSERTEFLAKLLQLPETSRKIGSLSGGQQRRVSFAVAMVHNPALLILDEPTVGVDPLLRQCIWKFLRQLATECKTTVLITTHYIEETRQSDFIGVMRNGRLLTESHPDTLLEKYNQEFLEDVVLTLCHGDDTGDTTLYPVNNTPVPAISFSETCSKTEGNEKAYHRTVEVDKKTVCQSMNESATRIQAIVSKMSLLYIRNLTFLAFSLTFPISQILVCAITIGNTPVDPKFGVVNYDSNLENCTFLKGTNLMDQCSSQDLSCQFLSRLDPHEVTLINYESTEAAHDAITQGNIWGYMQFPSNYSSAFHNLQEYNTLPDVNQDAESAHMIHFQTDMSNRLVTNFFQTLFLKTYEGFASDYKQNCGHDRRVGEFPLRVDEAIFGKNDADIRQFILISTMMITMFFFPMISSSFWFVFDKRKGTQSRAIVAGVKTWEIMLGSYVLECIITVFQIITSFIAVKVICDVTFVGSIVLAFVLCVFVGFCGVSMGFLIATICYEELQVGIIVMGLFLPNFCLSGLIWSTEATSTVTQYISMFFPCTLPAEALRSIVNRGAGLFHPKVWPGFLIMFIYATLFWMIIIRVYHCRARNCNAKKRPLKQNKIQPPIVLKQFKKVDV